MLAEEPQENMVPRTETELSRLLKHAIRAEGAMPFREFMQQALCHPEFGFYTRGPDIGSLSGPFQTNAKYGPFAFCLAGAIEQADALVGEPLRIVEFGGGTGELGNRVGSFLHRPHEYIVVEPSPGLRNKQRAMGLRTVGHPSELIPCPSFLLANEVLDAFPVHRVMGDGRGGIQELYVDVDGHGEFVERFDVPSTPLLGARLESEGIVLGRGQIGDVHLGIDAFMADARAVLSVGYFLVIDYGMTSTDLYHYSRRNGSLRCYHRQRQVHDPFDLVGEQDLTADLDFTAVERAAVHAGFEPVGRQWQGAWLKAVGIDRYREQVGTSDDSERDIETLTSPSRLGSTFEVLAFRTPGLPPAPGFS